MAIYQDLYEKHENEIVFSECDEQIFENLINFLQAKSFQIIEICRQSNNDEIYVYEKFKSRIMVWKSYMLDAIFVYPQDSNSLIDSYLVKCPRCNSENHLQRIFDFDVTEEDLEMIEIGTLDIFPGSYDRQGVPVQNWICKDCGLGWHNLNDLLFREEKRWLSI